MENSNKENNSNNSKKNPFIGLIIVLFFFFATSFMSQGLLSFFSQSPEPIPETTESVVEETVPSYPEDPAKMIGNMEFIGCSDRTIISDPVTFYYYRDIVTDQMFLISHNTDNHTVTPMTHPDTGLPLTYSEYQAMEAAKNPPKEGVYLVNNS